MPQCFLRTSESSMWLSRISGRQVFIIGGSENIYDSQTLIMQHPFEIGAHYFPPDAHPDQRSHRYRSFMIEEILTDHADHKVSSPTGDLLKFGVHALLSARPYHNHLGMYSDLSVGHYCEIEHWQSLNRWQRHSNRRSSPFAYSKSVVYTVSTN